MENDYGVGVSNRYEVFLEEEEDPLEMLRNQEQQKEAKKKSKANEKENRNAGAKLEPAKSKTATAPVPKKQIKETQNLKAVEVTKSKDENIKAPRGVRPAPSVKFAPESREERNNRRNREERVSSQGDARENRSYGGNESRGYGGEARTGGEEGEGRGRGRGGMGGRGRGRGSWRGGQGGEFRPKREFDRHSGSDKSSVKPVDKRDGGGAHNWGTYRDEIHEQLDSSYLNQESADWTPEKAGTDSQGAPASPAQTTDQPTDVKEGEPAAATEGTADGGLSAEEAAVKELTLDEWKALRGHREKPTFNIRKAGEGEDPSQWKKMYALNKKKEGEEEDDEEEEYEIAEYPQRVGRQKHLLEIDIHFSDSRRGGRMRGGRGSMGRGERGSGRGGDMGPRPERPVGPAGDTRAPPEGEVSSVRNDTESMEQPPRGGGGTGTGPGVDSAMRGRGGRGGRGGGGRGGNFYASSAAHMGPRPGRGYNRQQQSAPKVDDEKDFPSLG